MHSYHKKSFLTLNFYGKLELENLNYIPNFLIYFEIKQRIYFIML